MTETHLRFGLAPPPGVTTAWGARLIYSEVELDKQGSGLPVIWDRQDAIGERGHELCDRLNACYTPLRVAADRVRELIGAGTLRSNSDERFIIFDDDTIRIEANPQRSSGYLYVCAYFKAEAPDAGGSQS